MSKAKRRRKFSTALAIIASAQLVCSASIQELGVAPPQGAAESCGSVLATDLPACTVQDFTTTCSEQCRISVAGVANALRDTCTSAVASDQIGPLFSASGEVLLCSAQPAPTTVEAIVDGSTVTATIDPSAANRAHIEEPFVEPFPAEASQAPPAPVLSAVVSNIVPHISAPTPDPTPSNARSAIVSTGPNAIFIPPFVIPGPSSPPPPEPVISISTSPAPGQPSLSNVLLPGTVSTTTAPSVSIVAGPGLVDGQLPGGSASSIPTTMQTSVTDPDTASGDPTMSFVLQPRPSDPPLSPTPSSRTPQAASSRQGSSSATSTAADTANLGTNAMPTSEQMRQVNPGIIGGVVGGGLGAIVVVVALIYFLSRRKRKTNGQRESGRRPISSWDFIDQRKNLPSSSGSGGSVGLPEMSFIDRPILVDQRAQQVAAPQQVTIKRASGPAVTIRRVSGPPVVVRRSAGNIENPERRVSGLDERTVEALGMTAKSGKTKYTASQYSRNSTGADSIVVGYEAPEPVPPTPAMMLGSPGPTVYRGSTTTVGGGGSKNYGDRPRYPSPIDEVPEVPMPQVPMPRRSTFYDPFMGERMFRGQQYGRI